jgi:hypothetical protein
MTVEKRSKHHPGPRQTIDIVRWPLHGEGRLVWGNGPAFFIPDSGEPAIDLVRADWGGTTSDPPRSYQRVWPVAGSPAIEVDLRHGDNHSRWFSPLFGDGWLVTEAGPGHWMRFEDLNDQIKLRFEMRGICVGRPEYAEKMARSPIKTPPVDDPDEMNWSTFRARDGSIFTFRRGGPPPPAGTFIPVSKYTYADFSPKARKAYDKAKQEHERG